MSDLRVSMTQARLLAALREAAPQIRCAVIGAVAVGHHIDLRRSTRDADLVLDAEPEAIAETLRALGWTQDERMRQRWRAGDDFIADVLPASAALLARGSIQLDGDEQKMSLTGFDLLFDHGMEVTLADTNRTLLVASLPTLVVLKMVAWLDRPHDRRKDLGDIAFILLGALDNDDERRWDGSLPAALQFEDQSPYLMGTQVGTITTVEHGKVIDAFLAKLLDESAPWMRVMAQDAPPTHLDPTERVRSLLDAFQRGFEFTR